MQPFFGLFMLGTCLGVWWWNRKSGGYNGARPNWWRIVSCGIFLLGGLFGIGRTLLQFRPSAIGVLLFFMSYALIGGYLLSSETAWFRKKSAAGTPRMANPWKLFMCFAATGSGVDGLLRPFRGPLVPDGNAEMIGAMFSSFMIAILGLLGIIWELRLLYLHAKSLK